MNTSDCVDCGVTILGERLRCPGCHDLHVSNAIEDPTTPYDRADAAPSILTWWLVAAEVLAIMVLGAALAVEEFLR